MAEPNTSPNPLLFNDTQEIELQTHNRSAKFTGSLTLRGLEDEDVTQHHQFIDLTSSTGISYPYVLSFKNLSYSVKVRKKWKLPYCAIKTSRLLLDDISGEAREGDILAVIGSSGAGKSTLIDALAGRIEKESLQGTVALNGEVLGSRLLKILSAYVMQDDLLYPMLTVEETLMFSAEFRLPRSLSKAKKQARVQALIDQLGLQSAAKTIVGDERHRGVSGGERRRVSIGIDIIHDPILLFLDEPTSGLDSTSAFKVVNVLQRIAKSGSIVIMSIHQPSYRILSLLGRLIFLSQGQAVYNDAPGNLSHFFAEFGHPVPEKENPSEFALDLIRELEEAPGKDGIRSLVEFNNSWQRKRNSNKVFNEPSNRLKDAIKASIVKGKLVSTNTALNDSSLTSLVQTYANPFWVEMMIISKRLMTNSRRMPVLFFVRLVSVLVAGIVLDSLYWQLDDSPKGLQGRLGFLAISLTSIFFICADEIPIYLQERNIFIREIAYNAYRISSYLLAHILVSIPSIVILSLVFSVTTFWAIGFAGALFGFLFFFITVFATFWAGSSFNALIAGLVSHVIVGFIIVASLLGAFLLFCGFYIPRDQMRSYWVWFHYASLVKYPFQSILQNEYKDPTRCLIRGEHFFDDTTFVDFPVSTKIKLLESMGNVLGKNLSSSTCLATGIQILEHKRATDIGKWNCFWITVAFGFLFRLVFYFTLLFGSKNKRR